MLTGTIKSLTPRQIEVLRTMPHVGEFLCPFKAGTSKADVRTLQSLVNKGILYATETTEYSYAIRWGLLSERLYEKIFPGSFRQTYQRELQRLNDMALDFSEGSNANFMRQITVVKNLRELLIRAEK